MLSTSFLEKDSSVTERRWVAVSEDVQKLCSHGLRCVLCSLSWRLPCHFFPIILCFNPFHPSLVPLFFHTILSTPLPSSTFVFPHLFTVLSSFPTHPSLACLFFCLDVSLYAWIRWMDCRNWMIQVMEKQKRGRDRVVAFQPQRSRNKQHYGRPVSNIPLIYIHSLNKHRKACRFLKSCIVRPCSFRVNMKLQSQPILQIG